MLNSLFEQLYYEFQIMAHRSPHYVVNAYKMRQINKVLEPLREIMKEEVYARFLEKLEEPEMVTDPDGNEKGRPQRSLLDIFRKSILGIEKSKKNRYDLLTNRKNDFMIWLGGERMEPCKTLEIYSAYIRKYPVISSFFPGAYVIMLCCPK